MMGRASALALLVALLLAGGALAQVTPVPVPVIPVVPVNAAPAGAPDLHLLGPAAPLPAKARTNVFLAVVNLGPGSANDIRVLPQTGTGLVIVGQLERGLDDLAENESATLAVRVATPDTAGGATLTLTFVFRDDAGREVALTRSVSLQIAPPASDPLLVTSTAQPLTAGETGEVELHLSNPSDRPITQLDVTLRPQNQQVSITGDTIDIATGPSSSDVLRGATLGAGETRVITVPLVASLEAEDLELYRITASYTYQAFQRVQNFDFGVRILGSVNLRLLEAREVRTGEGLVVEATLVNTGSGTAWNPRVDVAETSGLRTRAPRLVEDLEPNDAITVRLPVERVRPATPGAPLLIVDWNDRYGELRSAAVEGDVQPPPPAPPSRWSQALAFLVSPVGLALAGLAVVVAAIALVIHLLHRRERAQEEQEARAASRTRREGPKKPKGKSGARPGA